MSSAIRKRLGPPSQLSVYVLNLDHGNLGGVGRLTLELLFEPANWRGHVEVLHKYDLIRVVAQDYQGEGGPALDFVLTVAEVTKFGIAMRPFNTPGDVLRTKLEALAAQSAEAAAAEVAARRAKAEAERR